MDRRTFPALAGRSVAGLALPAGLSAVVEPSGMAPSHLRVQTARYRSRDAVTEGLVSVFPDAPPPVLRMTQGTPFSIDVMNTLEEATNQGSMVRRF